jgi:hypothetical protein
MGIPKLRVCSVMINLANPRATTMRTSFALTALSVSLLTTSMISLSAHAQTSVNCSEVIGKKASASYIQVNGQSISVIDYCEQSIIDKSSQSAKIDAGLNKQVKFTLITSPINGVVKSTPINLGQPYQKNPEIVCREGQGGVQLICLPKAQAEKLWGTSH